MQAGFGGGGIDLNGKSAGLTLMDELILVLLNEDHGYLENLNYWNLECAFAGAVLGELCLQRRIDLDARELMLTDITPTGDEILDAALERIAASEEVHSAQYWTERLTFAADERVEQVLNRLTVRGILAYHSGGFWTMQPLEETQPDGTTATVYGRQEVRDRVMRWIYNKRIPDARDILLIGLLDACEAFRFMMQPEELDAAGERIAFIGNLEMVCRVIKEAVRESYVSLQASRRRVASRPIPAIALRDLLNRNLLQRNIARYFADLYGKYGPVVTLKAPTIKQRTVLLMGTEMNTWINRNARLFFRSKDYIKEFESVYGANRTIPGMDGAEHYRIRKLMRAGYSRETMENQFEDAYATCRDSFATWKVGEPIPATNACLDHISRLVSVLLVSVDTREYVHDLLDYQHRSLATHIQRALPKFMLSTPSMRRKREQVMRLVNAIRDAHTPAQRAGKPMDLIDHFLAAHKGDQELLPETDLIFMFAAPLIASIYVGNALAFTICCLASNPGQLARVQAEADSILGDGKVPEPEDLSLDAIGVTHRAIMEAQRLYPIIPLQLRHVMNECMVEGFTLPMNTRVVFGISAPHYDDSVFPDPAAFDPDRFAPPRDEHRQPGAYMPWGLGTHACLGQRLVECMLTLNVLMLAHHFDLETPPGSERMKINPVPTNAPHKSIHFKITRRRHAF